MSLKIGDVVHVGHNGAKLLGDEYVRYTDVTVEAVGSGWVVVRSEYGVLAATCIAAEDIREELEA